MHLTVENHEVIYGADTSAQHSIQLDLVDVTAFLERFFKLLFKVDLNRHCHRCTDSCRHALTLHLGRPFSRDFYACVPT